MSTKKTIPQHCLINLMIESAESVSKSKNDATEYLKEQDVDVDRFVKEGLQQIKQLQFQLKAAEGRKKFEALEAFRQRAREYVKSLMQTAEFSFATLIQRENISLQNRNIESFTDEDIESTLTEYYTLKMSEEDKDAI